MVDSVYDTSLKYGISFAKEHGLIFHIVAATEPKTLFSCKDHAT